MNYFLKTTPVHFESFVWGFSMPQYYNATLQELCLWWLFQRQRQRKKPHFSLLTVAFYPHILIHFPLKFVHSDII